jgi:hypothetical protein
MTTACIVVAVGIFCLGLFAAVMDRTNQRDDALRLLAKSEKSLAMVEAINAELALVAKTAVIERSELDQENMRLHLELSEAQLLAGTGRVPLPRVVPNGGQS